MWVTYPIPPILWSHVMKPLFAIFPPFLVALGDVIPANFDWGTVSATGLLGWYLWYTTKIIFPAHKEQISNMQESFREDFKLQRDHYERILDDIQTRYDKQNDQDEARMMQISDTLEKISTTLLEINKNERSN